MEGRRIDPRKRRTREHVIAAQGANYVERFIVHCGHACEPVSNDYGYDLVMFTYDGHGYAEEGQVYIQLKASDSPAYTAQGVAFDLDVRDYRLWVREPFPVFLVVYDASSGRGYWLYVQHYFAADPARRPAPGARTVRVHIAAANRVGKAFIRYARDRKNDIIRQLAGRIRHDG